MEDGGIENETLIREREEYEDEENEREKRQKVEGSGGGLLDNLISKFAPSSKTSDDVHDEDAPHGGDDGGSGGVINNFISNFFHRSSGGGEGEGEGEGEDDVKINGNSEERLECTKNEGNNDELQIKEVDKENGGGKTNGASILSTLVPEIVDPAPDEASMLIHSVVHD